MKQMHTRRKLMISGAVVAVACAVAGSPASAQTATTTTSSVRTRPRAVAIAQSPGSSVGRIEAPETSTRNGLHRRKPYAAARTASAANHATFRDLRPRW